MTMGALEQARPQIRDQLRQIMLWQQTLTAQMPTTKSNAASQEAALMSLLQTAAQGIGAVPGAEDEWDEKKLSVRQEGAVDKLYDPMQPQCHLDGWRLPDQAALTAHLDTIFQENKRQRESASKGISSRQWFSDKDDWVREFVSATQKAATAAASFFDGLEDEEEDKGETPRGAKARVKADDRQDHCPLCGEAFDMFFDPEEEEWMFEDAIYAQVQELGSAVPETRIVHKRCHVAGTVPIVSRIQRSESQSSLGTPRLMRSMSPSQSPRVVGTVGQIDDDDDDDKDDDDKDEDDKDEDDKADDDKADDVAAVKVEAVKVEVENGNEGSQATAAEASRVEGADDKRPRDGDGDGDGASAEEPAPKKIKVEPGTTTIEVTPPSVKIKVWLGSWARILDWARCEHSPAVGGGCPCVQQQGGSVPAVRKQWGLGDRECVGWV